MPLEIVDEYQDSAFARRQTGLLFNLPAPPPESVQLPPGVSLCMIVKNEERFLADCLASVRDCVDEMIVVDTGSTDRTIEIAREFGATVVEREWRNDFAWARNQALEQATRRWILVLDADEELAAESTALVRACGQNPADVTAVYLQIRNVIDDAAGEASMTHMLPRLFPNSPRVRYRHRIHENLTLDGDREIKTVGSPILILHKGYTVSILEERQKTKRNAPLLENALRENGDDPFAWFNFGIAAQGAGNWETATEALEKVFTLSDQVRAYYPVAYVSLAVNYAERLLDTDRAVAILEKGLQDCPNHPNLLFTYGWILGLQDRMEEARAYYLRAIESGVDARSFFVVDDEIAAWKGWTNIGTTYIKEGRYDEAIPFFERALAARPDADLLIRSTASAYEKAGRIYEAERLLAPSARRGDPGAALEYANFLLRRKRYVEAFAILDTLGSRIPDYSGVLLRAAIAARDDGNGDPEPLALRALAAAPGDGRVLRFLDELYAAQGATERRARLRADELGAPLAALPDFVRRSHRLIEENRLEHALEVAERGLALAPHEPMLRYNAALAAARLARTQIALAHLEAIGRDAEPATAALVLRAEIARRDGDLDGAVAALADAGALPARDVALLRDAAVALATALIAAGRVGDASRLAAAALA